MNNIFLGLIVTYPMEISGIISDLGCVSLPKLSVNSSGKLNGTPILNGPSRCPSEKFCGSPSTKIIYFVNFTSHKINYYYKNNLLRKHLQYLKN